MEVWKSETILAIFPYMDPLNLESQNQAKNIPVVLPSSPIKIYYFINIDI